MIVEKVKIFSKNQISNIFRLGFDYKSCNVLIAIEGQSQEISKSVSNESIEETGAGDQVNNFITFS